MGFRAARSKEAAPRRNASSISKSDSVIELDGVRTPCRYLKRMYLIVGTDSANMVFYNVSIDPALLSGSCYDGISIASHQHTSISTQLTAAPGARDIYILSVFDLFTLRWPQKHASTGIAPAARCYGKVGLAAAG